MVFLSFKPSFHLTINSLAFSVSEELTESYHVLRYGNVPLQPKSHFLSTCCCTKQLGYVRNVIGLPIYQIHGRKYMVKSFPFVFLVTSVYSEFFYGSRWAPLEQLLFFHKTLPCPYGREMLQYTLFYYRSINPHLRGFSFML